MSRHYYTPARQQAPGTAVIHVWSYRLSHVAGLQDMSRWRGTAAKRDERAARLPKSRAARVSHGMLLRRHTRWSAATVVCR